MATIQYKCNVCKKEAEIIENQQGLTIVGRCILTEGCSGKMKPEKRNAYNVREQFNFYDTDVNDFNNRNKFYKHDQINYNKKWVVSHKLNNHPFIVVYIEDNNSQLIELDSSEYLINYIDSENIQIVFNDPKIGVAHCIARTSYKDSIKTQSSDSDLFQVTTNGTFTFAIPKLLTKFNGTPTVTPTPSLPLDLQNITDIEIEIGVTKPNEEEIICFEKVPAPQINSPWIGTNEVIIRNRRNYYVKMKNILDFNIFDNAILTFKDIPDGTKIRFIRIDYGTGIKQTIPSRGAFLLLSKSPYGIRDKIVDKIIDLGELIDSSNWYFTYYDGEVYNNISALESTYPDIRKIS
jgi:hypothetical protein